jgi:hypothetical protein
LNNLVFLEVPWLKNPHEVTNKLSDARSLESLRQLVFF